MKCQELWKGSIIWSVSPKVLFCKIETLNTVYWMLLIIKNGTRRVVLLFLKILPHQHFRKETLLQHVFCQIHTNSCGVIVTSSSTTSTSQQGEPQPFLVQSLMIKVTKAKKHKKTRNKWHSLSEKQTHLIFTDNIWYIFGIFLKKGLQMTNEIPK